MFALRTLGRFSLERTADGSLILENQRKALALLALLAASRAAVSRDRLMSLLWSESDDARARGSLKQLLHLVRRQIGTDDAIEGLAELRLNDAVVTSDVRQFRNAIAARNDTLAVSLYAGPFLDGVFIDGAEEFERWSTTERNELARQFAEALERLAAAATQDGRIDEAVAFWRQLQQTDPTNGRLAVGVMTALHAAGDRAGAIRHARAHQALLHEELGAPPEPRVMQYAEELLRAPVTTRSAPADAIATPDSRVAAADNTNTSGVSDQNAGSPHTENAVRATPKPNSRITILATALAISVLAVAGWFYSNRTSPGADHRILQSGRVAVAVLVNRTNDP
ncbi:MAG: BTAD domain-containing putative transcriptional regulator, partial [Gemmatimonadaceae bacterium]